MVRVINLYNFFHCQCVLPYVTDIVSARRWNFRESRELQVSASISEAATSRLILFSAQKVSCTFLVPMVRGSRGKIRKSQGIWHSKVREKSEGQEKSGKSKYQGAKVKKMQKKWTVVRRLHTLIQNFFCLFRLQIISVSTFEFVPPVLFLVWLQAIENWHWYFAWTD